MPLLPSFPRSTSLLKPCSMGVQQGGQELLLLPPHRLPLLQHGLSMGLQAYPSAPVWVLLGQPWTFALPWKLLLLWPWCSPCSFLPALPGWHLLLAFLLYVFLEMPPALMVSAVSCSGSVAELLTSSHRGQPCSSPATKTLPPMPNTSIVLTEEMWVM